MKDGSCCEGLIGFYRLSRYSDSTMMDKKEICVAHMRWFFPGGLGVHKFYLQEMGR